MLEFLALPATDLNRLVKLARQGSEKTSRQVPDADEFAEIADFIGEQLVQGTQTTLLEVETRLRGEDRRALSWYVNLVRTFSGTVQCGDVVKHLIFIPLQAAPGLTTSLNLGGSVHELAAALEGALDLGSNSVKLDARVMSFEVLQAITPLEWRALTTQTNDLPVEPHAVGSLGAVVGQWQVPIADRARLSRKLMHAIQRTPALSAWKVRTEGLLEERAGASRIRVFPAVLLQDVFTMLRQLRLNALLEYALRQANKPATLRWHWAEQSGELSWRLGGEAGAPSTGSSSFPDEPAELVEQQLMRLAQRLQLQLSPPIGST